MNYAEGNVFKAVWRMCAAKQGRGKDSASLLYDAEKIVYFGNRLRMRYLDEANRVQQA
jgi:hypothetical protein